MSTLTSYEVLMVSVDRQRKMELTQAMNQCPSRPYIPTRFLRRLAILFGYRLVRMGRHLEQLATREAVLWDAQATLSE